MRNSLILLIAFGLTGLISAGLWWSTHKEVDPGRVINPVAKISPTLKVEPTIPSGEKILIDKIRNQTASASGTYAVYVYELKRKHGFGINEHVVMSGASIMKIPAMASVLRKVGDGQTSLDAELTLIESDRRLGSGPLQYAKAGSSFTLEKILTELGQKSDNTAWVMLNRYLGNEYINSTMEVLGMTETVYKQVDSTAADVGIMFTSLYNNKIPGVKWAQFQPYLTKSIYEDRLGEAIKPAEALVVHKVGTLEDAWMDAGVVNCPENVPNCGWEPFVVVVMNTGVNLEQAQSVVVSVLSEVWKYEKNGRR